ncbi:hypothetical protein D3C79_678590 [compost metagenome]
MLVDVALDVVGGQFQFFEQGHADIRVSQHIQQVLRVDFAAIQFMGLLGRALEDLQGLLAERVRRVDRIALHFRGQARGVVEVIRQTAHAPEEAGQPSSEQRVERVEHALMAKQLAVIVVADGHGLALPVLRYRHTSSGGSCIADLTERGHDRKAPELADRSD